MNNTKHFIQPEKRIHHVLETPQKIGLYGNIAFESAIYGAMVGLVWSFAVSAKIWSGIYWGIASNVIIWMSWTWALLQTSKSYSDAIKRSGFIIYQMIKPISMIAVFVGLVVWGIRALL